MTVPLIRRETPTLPPNRFGGADAVVLLAVVGLLATAAWLGHGMLVPLSPGAPPPVDLSVRWLPYYAGRSLLRMFLALAASIGFTLLVAPWAAKSRRARRVIIPALDILQSVPVLGFLSATVTLFMALAPGRLLGVELASIFAIFTGQVWNLTFAFYHSLLALPRDQIEAARIFRLSSWQRFTRLEVPAALIPLVWNGMMSFGGGWFFLAASEAITVLNQEWLLPGVGSYMALAVKAKDLTGMGWALLTMVGMIVLVDRGFWRPLVAWAERFKLEESEAATVPRSSLLDLLRRSRVVARVEAEAGRLDEAIDRFWRRLAPASERPADPRREQLKDRAFMIVVAAGLGVFAIQGAAFVLTQVSGREALHVVGLAGLTMLRVAVVVALSGLVWTPVGVWIGLSPRAAQFAQPVAQVLASFPANFLFPFMTVVFLRFHLSLEWGSAVLMTLGAQWYVLFNTIAGSMAIPNDLREMAQNLSVRGWLRWRALILPAIFPAWVTGALTAAGGAWNASIVAEVVTWGDTRLTATGLGAYITQATSAGEWPRIVLGITVMSAFVVAVNRTLWHPLSRLAESRYRLG
jgi:NitT/TauT family transport system permease protein